MKRLTKRDELVLSNVTLNEGYTVEDALKELAGYEDKKCGAAQLLKESGKENGDLVNSLPFGVGDYVNIIVDDNTFAINAMTGNPEDNGIKQLKIKEIKVYTKDLFSVVLEDDSILFNTTYGKTWFKEFHDADMALDNQVADFIEIIEDNEVYGELVEKLRTIV